MVTKRRSWTPLITVIAIIFTSIIAITLAFCFIPIVTQEDGVKFTVHEGRSLKGVIDDLQRARTIRYEFLYKILVRVYGGAEELKAGEYFFPKGTTPPKMLQQLTTGSGMLYHSFSIIPGWTLKDLRRALLRNSSFKHVSEHLTDSDLMKAMGYPELQPEGQFFPDTYFFSAGSEDIVLLKRALKTMHKKLEAAWVARAPNLPFKTPYEALIAASIIEKEAYLKKELPIIAGVMINRLQQNMRLQFDPTVIYGVGDKYEGKIRKVDLQDKNPYNTYLNKGLPPTPISMPSLSAIQAVLHPAKHDYFYFVAQGKGAHRFSKELSEHNGAVASMRKNRGAFNTKLVNSCLTAVVKDPLQVRQACHPYLIVSPDTFILIKLMDKKAENLAAQGQE